MRNLSWLIATALLAGVPAAEARTWRPCPDNPASDCTTVAVPVDWSHPDGERFDLAVARRPARGARTGTLVYLPAGPGSSGVDAVTNDQIFDLLFPPAVAEHFDIVSFDPRGVRRSHAVECDADLVTHLADRPTPTDQHQFDELLAVQAEVGADCRRRTGTLFDHLDSVNAARDLDALRTTLGEPTLNLYALSYGTVIGQMYAETFPRHIRTMVLDAVVDHGVDSDRFALTGALAAQEAFDQFVTWCAAEPSCALHGTDVRARLAALFTRAEQGRLPDPDDPSRLIDPAGLTYRVVSPFSRPDLPGVASDIARLEGNATTSNPDTTSNPAATTPLPIYISCADNRNDTTSFAHAERLRARSRTVAPDVRESAFKIANLCINPPVPSTNPQHPLRVHGAPPIMVLNSRYDVSTPYQGAQHVAAQLPGSTLVTYDGMGHGAATRTPCAGDLVYLYLSERRMPPPDTHCPAV
jgi:pimeloyl-ACP methyl ester carboxylesterase